jgi:shikimate dehydrogenase
MRENGDGRPPITGVTAVVGVIGNPIAHSLSPLLHNAAFKALGRDWVSVAFAVPQGKTADALAGMRALGLRGLSVTMPHKEEAAARVDRLSATAAALGAVNCIVAEGGALVGENTDGAGFVESLRRGAGFEPDGRRCLVLGAGGAARAVVRALADAGAAEIVVVNRDPGRAERAAALGGRAGRTGTPADAGAVDLVVQATPAGMRGGGAEDVRPAVAGAGLAAGQVAADLVYAPLETPWLRAAAAAGATTVGGLGMLVHQAALQLALWTGEDPPLPAMWAAATEATAPGD